MLSLGIVGQVMTSIHVEYSVKWIVLQPLTFVVMNYSIQIDSKLVILAHQIYSEFCSIYPDAKEYSTITHNAQSIFLYLRINANRVTFQIYMIGSIVYISKWL